MVASNKAGMTRGLSAETIWLLNREAIADRHDCTPVEVENWPAYEQRVALLMLEIRAEAKRRRPGKR